MDEHACSKSTSTATTLCPPDGWDPFTHVLWCFHEDSRALHTALRELENEWEGREAAKVARVKRHLTQQLAILLLVASVFLSYVVEHDFDISLWNVAWSSLIIPSPAYLTSAVVSTFLTTPARKADSPFHKAVPLVPLVMQLEGQPLPQRYAPTFKLRERSSQTEVQDDMQALLLLQRQCALSARAGTINSSKASYIVAETVPDRSPLIQIPRNMMLSTLFAPASLRDNCWVDVPHTVAGKKGPCFHNDLMAFLLTFEKQLQRQIIRTLIKADGKQRLDAASLPPLPYCLVKTNRKNAPFFTAAQWDVIELLTSYRRISVERIMTRMTSAFLHASDLARKGLLVGNAEALENLLEIPEAERDESLTDLDIRDAVSLVFSKGLVDMLGEVAVAPAAYEFEAQLNVYSWASRNKMWYRPDEKGLTWRARGEYSFGSEVEVNHGLLSNLETIYRFGIKVPANPWGPVFFLRREDQDGPSSSFGDQGWVSVHTPLIQTTMEAELMLPDRLLTNRTTPRYGTMCFHRHFQKEKPVLGCPPKRIGSPSNLNKKNAQERGSSVPRATTTESIAVFECDYRTTFNVFPFGYGSFMLHKLGPVGGLSRIQYQCLRAMLVEEGAGGFTGEPPGETPLVAAEERITDVLIKACSLQLESARQAARILEAELRRQKSDMSDSEEECSQRWDSSCRDDHDDSFFLERERDVDTKRRRLDVTQMMLEATNEYETLLRECVSYFELVAEDIKLWKHVGLEF